jgi:hypothetical protein
MAAWFDPPPPPPPCLPKVSRLHPPLSPSPSPRHSRRKQCACAHAHARTCSGVVHVDLDVARPSRQAHLPPSPPPTPPSPLIMIRSRTSPHQLLARVRYENCVGGTKCARDQPPACPPPLIHAWQAGFKGTKSAYTWKRQVQAGEVAERPSANMADDHQDFATGGTRSSQVWNFQSYLLCLWKEWPWVA